jgi:DNA (cytosine-5)-methyltransferase 1
LIKRQLVLSIFPGLGIWERAFEAEGFCVVRGPELLFGSDVKDFHPIGGKFDGVIGGIPCQAFSRANNLNGRNGTSRYGDMTPEFERIIYEAQPFWWLSENVREAPLPSMTLWCDVLDAWEFGASQHRRRRFCSNLPLLPLTVDSALRHPDPLPTVTASEHKVSAGPSAQTIKARAGRKLGRRLTLSEINEAFGMPADWDTPALTVEMKYHMRGNGVPMAMGKALACAIKEATK